jgi:hypothetical protein
MRIRLAVALALVLALSACGLVDDEPKAKPEAAATKAAMDGALPNVAEGRSMPEALSDFACELDDKGTWSASGAVTNRTSKPVSFQVTVHVGTADGEGAPASTRRISSVQKNGSVGFELDKIKTRATDGLCHVQVLALASSA